MRLISSLVLAVCLTTAIARAAENQPTTNRLQQPTPEAVTTNALNKPQGQQTTTGLGAHSRKQPTANNLQTPSQPPDSRSSR